MLNWGYHRTLDLFLHPFRFDISQERLAVKSIGLLDIQADNNVLDIGCGRGKSSFIMAMANPSASITGMDILSANLNIAKGLYGNINNLEYVQGNAMDTGLRDASFDRVHCLEAAHHFNREAFIKEAFRILKPGGILVLVDFTWIDSKYREINMTPESQMVRDIWKYDDFSSIEEYHLIFRNTGFNIYSESDWSFNVLTAAQKRFSMLLKVYYFEPLRKLLFSLNNKLNSFTKEDWKAIIQAAKAHASIRQYIRYKAFVLEK